MCMNLCCCSYLDFLIDAMTVSVSAATIEMRSRIEMMMKKTNHPRTTVLNFYLCLSPHFDENCLSSLSSSSQMQEHTALWDCFGRVVLVLYSS